MDNKEPIPKKRVAIYLRVSTDDQVEMYWIDHQKSKIQSYIDSRSDHWEIPWDDCYFFDSGVSWATDIDNRPQLKKLFDMLEYAPEWQKPFDLVLVYKIDRFARRLSVLLDIVDRLRQYNVGFVSCTESIDTDSPFGNAMLGILWVFAELERSLIQERTFWGRNEAVKQWEWMNDKYWYIREGNIPKVFDKEAVVVKDIFDMYVNKRFTVAQIARELGAKEIPVPAVSRSLYKIDKSNRKTSDPYKRQDKTIRDILSDEVYLGVYYYNKSITKKDYKTGKKKIEELPKDKWMKSDVTHIPIIDDVLFEKAQELTENKGWFTNQKSDSSYLLSWLLRCTCCKNLHTDKPLHITWLPAWNKAYYQCNGKNSQKFKDRRCTLIPLPKEDLEEFVIEHIKNFMWNPTHFHSFIEKHQSNGQSSEIVENEMQAIIYERNGLIKGMENTKEMFAKWHIDTNKYDKFMIDNETKIGKLEQRLIDLKQTFNKKADETKYYEWIKLMHSIIGQNLEKLFEDKKLLKQFLWYIIADIYVYGRDATPEDRVTGKKKQNWEVQKIPYKIDIRMRLPQEILDSLYQEVRNQERQEVPTEIKWWHKIFHKI